LSRSLNTFAPGLIQAVLTRTAGSHVALHGNFSGPVSTIDLVKSSKDVASFIVCTRKKIFLVGGCRFFMSDVISGGLLGHLSPLHLALGLNR